MDHLSALKDLSPPFMAAKTQLLDHFNFKW